MTDVSRLFLAVCSNHPLNPESEVEPEVKADVGADVGGFVGTRLGIDVVGAVVIITRPPFGSPITFTGF